MDVYTMMSMQFVSFEDDEELVEAVEELMTNEITDVEVVMDDYEINFTDSKLVSKCDELDVLMGKLACLCDGRAEFTAHFELKTMTTPHEYMTVWFKFADGNLTTWFSSWYRMHCGINDFQDYLAFCEHFDRTSDIDAHTHHYTEEFFRELGRKETWFEPNWNPDGVIWNKVPMSEPVTVDY